MPEDKMYHITVGHDRPTTVKIGTIERNTGSSVVKERGETLNTRGDIGFPNGTKIWAARATRNAEGKLEIPKDAKGNFMQLAPTDTAYKGEIIRLKWGAPGGSLMDVRYLRGYPSLDVLYQERILGFRVDETNENSADVFYLMFPNGDNDIDETIDFLLAEHLKGHAYNRDSKSKDPNFHTYFFFEKSFEQIEVEESKVFDDKFEAGKIVREADTMEKARNLYSIIKSVTDEEPEDNRMYAYLKMIADKKPAQVLKAVADYKLKVSNVFEKLKSYEAIDLTVDGFIVATKPKREIIAQDFSKNGKPVKGKVVFDYLLENIADPDVFEITFKLIQITDKL